MSIYTQGKERHFSRYTVCKVTISYFSNVGKRLSTLTPGPPRYYIAALAMINSILAAECCLGFCPVLGSTPSPDMTANNTARTNETTSLWQLGLPCVPINQNFLSSLKS